MFERKFNRRQFIESATALAGGVALPTLFVGAAEKAAKSPPKRTAVDRVTLGATGALPEATTALADVERVVDVTTADGTIEVTAEGARTLLPTIISVASEAGATVSSVEIAEPDLEAVFLHLTGKALRD